MYNSFEYAGKTEETREMALKNVVFDFGGVVVNYDPLGYLRGEFSDEATVRYIMEHLFESEYWRLFDQDRADRAACNAIVLKRAYEDGYGPQMERVQARWLELMWTKEDTAALVRELRERGVPVYYLTNMPRDVWPEFVGRGLKDLFLGGVASFEVRATKPDRRIYEALFDRCGLVPGECLFFDDMPANVEGARSSGMEAVLFQSAAQARTELFRRGIVV